MTDHTKKKDRSGRSGSRGKRIKPPPAYRQRDDQGIVTLSDAGTKKRRDYWLGEYNSPESRELYHRLIAEWEAAGRRLPQAHERTGRRSVGRASSGSPLTAEDQFSLNHLVLKYWVWAKSYYSRSEATSIHAALQLLRTLFGTTPAREFGPNRLRLLRDEMVRGQPTGEQPRKPWSRKHTNSQVHRVCAIFKWAASHELLPASVYQQLKTVPALRRGRTEAAEGKPVGPVPLEYVEAVRPYVSRQVAALIDLQLYTGARGGELFKLRPIDIGMEKGSGVWTINPQDHKTSHHGHARTIYLGPKAQAVVEPFLVGRAVDDYLFSPAEAEQERLAARSAARKTPLSCGNVPGSNKVAKRQHPPDETYTAASYRRAIDRACERAFPLPNPVFHPQLKLISAAGEPPKFKKESLKDVRDRLDPEQIEELEQWKAQHHWHPHQLRHTAATLIRREFGLEAARIILGHSSALITEAVYAQRDMEKVVEVVRKIG